MKGELKHMGVADLIQHNCEDQRTARIQLLHDGVEASIFLDQGNVVHAVCGDLEGEDAVFKVLGWKDGTFSLDMDMASPTKTIERSCNGLLLKGAQLLDETSNTNIETTNKKEKKMKKGEIIAETLQQLLQQSTDVQGAAIVGTDGLVYSAIVPEKDLDENIVGAASAAILGLSKRSVGQLKRGNFTQTLIQGDSGNIIVTGLSEQTLFVGLTPKEVNLGMAFAEVRDFADKLIDIV